MAMRDDDKLVRQLSLVSFLMAQQRPVTASEIHEAVEGYGGMSEQAFLRRFYADRAEIEAMGLRLSVERPGDDPFQGDLYALPAENYYLPPLDFDDNELSALHTCLYLLEGQFAYAEPLRLALQHLTLGRPSPLDDHAARTVSVNLLGSDYSPEVASHLTKIESAITRRKTIRFTYYTIGRDARSEREVDPYSLLYKGGNWYVVGYSHEREDIRNFRLSRIEGRITFKTRAEHDFSMPTDFDLAPYRERAEWQLQDPQGEATIELSSTIAWWVEQMFGSHGATTANADGSATFTTSYGSRHELLAFVLGLGAEATIAEPAAVREEMIATLERIRERHQPDGDRGAPDALVPSAAEAEEPDDEAAAPPAAPPGPEKVVPVERFARLLALMTRLLAACGDAAEARIELTELQDELNLDRVTLEEDIGLLNLINFGGGCYALYAQVDGGEVSVIKETYGDRFARPARLSPLEAKALLWALEFIGDRLPTEAGARLSTVQAKVEAAIG
ncbi:MAG: WYL domain-containing protein, partial [Miltoncostaeaceae bacterium]